MLGVQFVQQAVAQVDQAVLLGHLILFLFMAQGRLTDEQDDQQQKAKQKQIKFRTHNHISLRPSRALKRVTSSVYSRSPPTGTPWAMRVQRMFMGFTRRAI